MDTDLATQLFRSAARMPKRKMERTIREMKVGDTGWTVPWAMWVDDDRTCWLDGNYTLNDEPRGTVQMEVARVKDGFIVDVTRCDFEWGYGHAHQGGSDDLPVIRIMGV